MILLPHGCSCSNPTVNPKNWKSGGKSLLKSNWRITYYFRDPEFSDKYKYGKLIPIKGMNRFKTLEERRAATQLLIDEELYMLKVKGYNPITKTINGPDIELTPEIHPETTVCEAIELARKKIEGEPSTLSDIKTITKYFNKSCRQLRYHLLRIKDLKRIHVNNILENQKKQNNYTNERFNKARAYMLMVFKQLVLSDAIEHNVVTDIPKKKETKRLKEVPSENELEKIKEYLRINHYGFFRYMQVFFHSGCRSTELFNVKRKDIDIKNERFKVLVKKGRQFEEQWRAININSFKYWNELYLAADEKDYIFSYNFCPGKTKIAARQVSNKWRKYVKNKLNVTADFYSLKHLHTTKVIDLYDKNLAAGINGHKSTRMNDEHYDTRKKIRMLEEAKRVNVNL
ncbi:tyrosine-type recombinase/integrase [Gaetbulibacter sp. PBL-D1]|uniref:tyrosine-type recombinase/integrase n=1 Tax=Gaetbulibacter sp. PBL-D1 TaxID=3422594 RepID=UPI003D2EE557